MTRVRLLKLEGGSDFLGLTGITTVTFYRGLSPAAGAAALRSKVV
eukprot:SAG11_NODE_21509_length_424_cov_0.541538_1_plen_44_part_01